LALGHDDTPSFLTRLGPRPKRIPPVDKSTMGGVPHPAA
jgi:hypothetical protein